jgi:hypothetical protein
MNPPLHLPSSYRDTDGFVFEYRDKIYRYIKPQYFADYKLLFESGLYEELINTRRLIKHEEIDAAFFTEISCGDGKIIFPEQLSFICYPYEWGFDMWKDAAIVTLKIVAACIEKGMILKDATPFNIQFYNGRPFFIDTLSFKKYESRKPWIAYRQFCESFLGPLLLMHYGHRDMGKLFLAYPDGIPLEVIKGLLPSKSKWNLHVYMHIWLHAKISDKSKNKQEVKSAFSKQKLQTLLKGLTIFVIGLTEKKIKSEWGDYYSNTILGAAYLDAKKNIFLSFTGEINFKRVIDLGANDGYFSLLLKDKAEHIVSVDADSNCINELYRQIRKNKIKNILPIVNILNTPSPAIGWKNEERKSLTQRFKADLVLALALVHHLAIGANVPLPWIAEWLKEISFYLVIEFIPKTDEKVKQLLQNREDIFDDYNLQFFKDAFSIHYIIEKEEKISNTDRILFLMKKKT